MQLSRWTAAVCPEEVAHSPGGPRLPGPLGPSRHSLALGASEFPAWLPVSCQTLALGLPTILTPSQPPSLTRSEWAAHALSPTPLLSILLAKASTGPARLQGGGRLHLWMESCEAPRKRVWGQEAGGHGAIFILKAEAVLGAQRGSVSKDWFQGHTRHVLQPPRPRACPGRWRDADRGSSSGCPSSRPFEQL